MSSYNQMKKKNVLVQSLHGYLGITLSEYLVFLDHKGFLAHAWRQLYVYLFRVQFGLARFSKSGPKKLKIDYKL